MTRKTGWRQRGFWSNGLTVFWNFCDFFGLHELDTYFVRMVWNTLWIDYEFIMTLPELIAVRVLVLVIVVALR